MESKNILILMRKSDFQPYSGTPEPVSQDQPTGTDTVETWDNTRLQEYNDPFPVAITPDPNLEAAQDIVLATLASLSFVKYENYSVTSGEKYF